MPSVGIKVVTHVEGEKNSISGDTSSPLPQLPDTVACCEAANVTDRGCVDLMCDPLSLPAVEMGDMVKCAPFGRQMFTCLADARDHRPCCAQRGIPATCLDLCSGDVSPHVSRYDFRYLGCFQYMHDMSSCLLEGYNVLPSSPTHLRFSNLHHNFVILHWDPPARHSETVTSYELVVLSPRIFTFNLQSDLLTNLRSRLHAVLSKTERRSVMFLAVSSLPVTRTWATSSRVTRKVPPTCSHPTRPRG